MVFKAKIKRFVLHRRIRRRQRKGRYLVSLPSALGDKRRAAIKLSSRSSRKCAGHRTQSAAHPLTGKRRRGAKASGITQKCAVSRRPRCDSGCFYSPNKSNICFQGQLVSVSFECWGDFIGTDEDWSPSLRPAPLWAKNTWRIRLLPPIRARLCADGRRAWPIGAHGSLWQPPSPAFPPPSAAATRSRVRTKVLKRVF